MPQGDFRLKNSREVALTVKILLERSVSGRGKVGPRLLARFYLRESPWESFSLREKQMIRKTEKMFRERRVQARLLGAA